MRKKGLADKGLMFGEGVLKEETLETAGHPSEESPRQEKGS